MIKDLLFQIKYLLHQLTFKRKKNTDERLRDSFGNLKDETFDFELIEKFFRNKKHTEAYQVLSDRTCNDLDLDDLFIYIDRTNSRVGQQYIYDKLRTISVNEKQTELDEEIISTLSKNDELRISLQKSFQKLNHKDAYLICTLFQEEHLNPPKWFTAVKLLSFASLLALILAFFNSIFIIVLISLSCVNLVLHYWNKKNLTQYSASIPQLIKLNDLATQLFKDPLFKRINPELHRSIRVIDEVKSRMSFFQLEARLQGDFEIIAWSVFEIFKTIFLLEPLLLFGVLKRLNNKRCEIENVFNFIGHIDFLFSIASLRKGLDTFCLPKITDEQQITVQDIYHPLIPNCTKNSVRLDNKSILLTGSNMSGKTSFIRAIGLSVITGLTINTCFSKAMTFPLLKVFSAIRISDDLMNDKSYYFEEVLTIKEMLIESYNGKNLFLLDEIFKGTNTVERIAAGKSVLSALAKNENKILVSTHDIELTEMLSSEYELYHFSETVSNNNVGFDYKLKEGKLKHRNAIRILKINDYPSEVVEEAFTISDELDNKKTPPPTKPKAH